MIVLKYVIGFVFLSLFRSVGGMIADHHDQGALPQPGILGRYYDEVPMWHVFHQEVCGRSAPL
jgi:hypothetical protein